MGMAKAEQGVRACVLQKMSVSAEVFEITKHKLVLFALQRFTDRFSF